MQGAPWTAASPSKRILPPFGRNEPIVSEPRWVH
jgi:hypothetical protein